MAQQLDHGFSVHVDGFGVLLKNNGALFLKYSISISLFRWIMTQSTILEDIVLVKSAVKNCKKDNFRS